MSKIYTLVLLLLGLKLSAQVQTPRFNTVVNANCHGFYEYLPQGYNPNGTTTYPLIIFAHGAGETGDGSNGQLQKVLVNGIPKLINQGTFPTSFTVGGQTFRFIVISPQFIGWPSPADMNDVLDYAIAHYKVNINRVYVTGLSMGGGATWEFAGHLDMYAQRIAAIVPVCGASWPEPQRAYKIAANDVAVWATHNNGDPTVPVHYTDDYVMHINSAPNPPAVPAKKTIFNSNSHDAWSATYTPSFTENGLNIYQWMLQFQRSAAAPLPVVLTDYRVAKLSSSRASVSWTTSDEINNHHFTIERSVDGTNFASIGTVAAQNRGSNYSFTDEHPLKGDNYYRLSQTDANGTVKYFEIKKLQFGLRGSLLTLSPNPVKDRLQVHLEQEERGEIVISIFNASGSAIKHWRMNKPDYEWTQVLSLSELASGSYLLQVRGKGFTETQRLVKN